MNITALDETEDDYLYMDSSDGDSMNDVSEEITEDEYDNLFMLFYTRLFKCNIGHGANQNQIIPPALIVSMQTAAPTYDFPPALLIHIFGWNYPTIRFNGVD
ncbi:hypothetical protein TNCV_4416111 [Trichonephila clavipes]|uniref:Uncharacterized protein n=1 Tax=Trichonephila clavipes TaxID=2585209 RepID=A0A8X6S4M6_TRICX|nr:hypothetical protein TNCV_4416111 [Trichonephila clavipes]